MICCCPVKLLLRVSELDAEKLGEDRSQIIHKAAKMWDIGFIIVRPCVQPPGRITIECCPGVYKKMMRRVISHERPSTSGGVF